MASGPARARIGALALLCALTAACSGTAAAAPGTHPGGAQAAADTDTFRAPEVSINPADHSQGVAPSTVVTVTAADGNLDTVSVVQTGSGMPLNGTMSRNRRTWTAGVNLEPSTTYIVTASAMGPGNTATNATSTFTTTGGRHLITEALPDDGSTVGVGMPIKLVFNTPIPAELQSALVSHVRVSSQPSTQGDWHWFSPWEVHWRPADFWNPGTKVTVDAELQGVNGGNGYWGYGNWSSTFTIGEKHYSVIDHNTETMQVYTGDQLVRTIPVSLGKAGFPTLSGTLVVWYKSQQVMMDSCASGIDCTPGTANYYKEYVYWDTAISTDGFFIHDAYWDIFAQGHYDYSHGCVNVSPDNATWFFGYSQPGDVVVIKNTARQADAGDGEGDWQLPFDQWANSGGAAPPTPSATNQGGV